MQWNHTAVFLHFFYSLTIGLPNPIESFVFSTKLTRITKHLRKKELIESLKAVSRNVNDWSGGTRIGGGWDLGSPEELKREISRLQRICY